HDGQERPPPEVVWGERLHSPVMGVVRFRRILDAEDQRPVAADLPVEVADGPFVGHEQGVVLVRQRIHPHPGGQADGVQVPGHGTIGRAGFWPSTRNPWPVVRACFGRPVTAPGSYRSTFPWNTWTSVAAPSPTFMPNSVPRSTKSTWGAPMTNPWAAGGTVARSLPRVQFARNWDTSSNSAGPWRMTVAPE